MGSVWLKSPKILYDMTGGRLHSSGVISLTEIKRRVFEWDMPGTEKSCYSRNQLQQSLAQNDAFAQYVQGSYFCCQHDGRPNVSTYINRVSGVVQDKASAEHEVRLQVGYVLF